MTAESDEVIYKTVISSGQENKIELTPDSSFKKASVIQYSVRQLIQYSITGDNRNAKPFTHQQL